MPHTSYTHSCIMNSINSTELILRDYVITNNGEASFTVYNPGPGDNYAMRNLTVEDDGLWHKCQGSADSSSLPWQLVACDYLLGRAGSKIGFRFQWYCDDRDPYDAYVFFLTVSLDMAVLITPAFSLLQKEQVSSRADLMVRG